MLLLCCGELSCLDIVCSGKVRASVPLGSCTALFHASSNFFLLWRFLPLVSAMALFSCTSFCCLSVQHYTFFFQKSYPQIQQTFNTFLPDIDNKKLASGLSPATSYCLNLYQRYTHLEQLLPKPNIHISPYVIHNLTIRLCMQLLFSIFYKRYAHYTHKKGYSILELPKITVSYISKSMAWGGGGAPCRSIFSTALHLSTV